MIRAESSIVVNRPLEEVFAYLTDPQSDLAWVGSLVDVGPMSADRFDVGTRWQITIKFLGRRWESTIEVVEYEPKRRYCNRTSAGPVSFIACREVEPAGEGTRVTQSLEGDPGAFFRLAEPLVGRAVKRQFDTDLGTLKDVLEAQA